MSCHINELGHWREPIRRKLLSLRVPAQTSGDCMLVEFGSVVAALRCAVEMQRGMAARKAEVPEAGRTEFRVGNIIGDADDIYGDGINQCRGKLARYLRGQV